MPSFLWLEGVDFGEHIADTNDISIIRGASLALLAAGEAGLDLLKARAPGQVELVFSGASLALYRLSMDAAAARGLADGLLDDLARMGAQPNRTTPVPPFAHLRFVAGVAEDTGKAEDVRRAHAAARLAQMTGAYPRRAVTHGGGMCAYTRRLPADTTMRLTKDQAERLNIDLGGTGKGEVHVSRSAAARRAYGRQARKSVFAKLFPGRVAADHDFVNDLHEMVALPPVEEMGARTLPNVPEAVENKIAVFYADGNSFSAIRAALGGGADALKHFSATVRDLMETKVIAGVLDELGRRAASTDAVERRSAVLDKRHVVDEYEGDQSGSDLLRFELLLYGGDELCFIVPAWLGLDVAKLFFERVAGASITGGDGKVHRLHFKAGIAFVPNKMPIAASRELAKALAEAAKLKNGSALCVHAFESVEPPANGLATWRAGLFGDPDKKGGGHDAERAENVLRIPADKVGMLIDDLVGMKNMGFPRSQLYGALLAAQWATVTGNGTQRRRWPDGLGSPDVSERVSKSIRAYNGPLKDHDAWRRLEDAMTPDAAAILAWLHTHLWDYADPFGLLADETPASEAA